MQLERVCAALVAVLVLQATKKEMTVRITFAKFTRLTSITIAFVAILIMFPFSQVQSARASAMSDPIVLVAVDVTSSSSCQTHYTRTQGTSSITTSEPCLPGTAMKTERVPLSQALAHHWFHLPLSSATPQQISAMMDTAAGTASTPCPNQWYRGTRNSGS